MINVVFSDNEKGALKSAFSMSLPRPSSEYKQSPQVLKKPESQVPQKPQRTREPQEIQMPQDVFSINVALDLGAIDCEYDSPWRRDVLAELFESGSWDTKETIDDHLALYWKRYLHDMDVFFQRVQQGEAVRIWYSMAPFSLCGFYATIAQLVDMNVSENVQITGVHLPLFICVDGMYKPSIGWGEVHPQDWLSYLDLEKRITKKEQQEIKKNWRELQTEETSLRTVINGHPHNVLDDFYDPFILKIVSYETFPISEIILRTMDYYHLGISDAFIASRIKKLIDSDSIMLYEENKRFYDSLICLSD